MSRAIRSETRESKARIMKAANREIEPPAHVELDERELLYFDDVVAEFARADWTQHQLTLAAFLARALAETDEITLELKDEGSILYSQKGTPVINPLRTVLQMNATTIFNYRRSLQLNTVRAPGGNAQSRGKLTQATKQIELDAQHLEDEDSDENLLAAPGKLPAPQKQVAKRRAPVAKSDSSTRPPWERAA